jgi:hypothetical protein
VDSVPWSCVRLSACEKRLSVKEPVTVFELRSQTGRYNQEVIESRALINRLG